MEATSRHSRRAVIAAGLGGLAAAVAHAAGRPQPAQAGHDGTNVLHLGEYNHTPAVSGLVGTTLIDADREGRVLDVRNSHTGPNSGAIEAWSKGAAAAVQGNAAFGAVGLMGVSHLSLDDPAGFGKGSGDGVFGGSGTGNGVVGASQSGDGVRGYSNDGTGVQGDSDAGVGGEFSSNSDTGVKGHSDAGVGGEFSSNSGTALSVGGPAHIGGNSIEFLLGVDNEQTGEAAGGIFAISHGGKPAVEGDAIPSQFAQGVGVQGVSGSDATFGQGPGIGVQGISGTGVGVEAVSAEGTALRVLGRAAFSTAGSASVPAGQNVSVVANPAVTGDSHITVTLVGNPGPRQLRWVERTPGVGFKVHFSGGLPGQRPQVPFTYLVVKPTNV